MKALVQRVSVADVTVAGEVLGKIEAGVLVLVCAVPGDGQEEVEKLARKIANLRIHADEAGKMNLSLVQSAGSALVVSQFTLAADLSRGNRPGFTGAAAPAEAEALYEDFCTALAGHGVPVERGRFGADMAVNLVNDGPVTIWIDTAA
ncbi:MAG: D-aminoacyl-tRNA deacylase [Alphaproteobacteria bacterium]|jgi:D-tyrosyl-tRNA(Tyr) deacylase|nr:D-tyrosyl-tRNA(Tyr) deacylase [Rhodospirillaceae bacterium]MDP6403703.1 D-aminoacyl-tRNA deacylase [Alphaproteobacteria bacterium]MDP6623128.1 D-aminoacyl-tRNA deacylase [Alphaproteobacteria bacterium]|tara:strand:- start:447 stop:890 length:444 start_codon:yes stop_codon:yes gene_type:complete